MLKLVVNRLGLGVLTLFAVSLLIFVCTQILPGDVASAVLGNQATPEALAVFRKELGLDQPAYLRFFNWLWGALRGDLGVAMTNKRVIIDELLPRLFNTLFLAGYAALIAIPLSVGLGILAAINEGKFVDRAANVLTLITISVPEFFIAYLLIILFVVNLEWFPSLATVFPGISFGERVYITTLPALALTLLVAAHMLRMTRSSVLAVMSSPYVEMAFLKGACTEISRSPSTQRIFKRSGCDMAFMAREACSMCSSLSISSIWSRFMAVDIFSPAKSAQGQSP